jgi:hypothetical protein
MPAPKLPPMTPSERQLWLVSHRAPPDMLLVTQAEFFALRQQLERAIAIESEGRGAVAALDSFGYWQGNTTLPEVCADVAFDARRYERATNHAIETVNIALSTCQALAAYVDDEAGDLVIQELADKLGETLAFLRAQAAAKREQPQPPTP